MELFWKMFSNRKWKGKRKILEVAQIDTNEGHVFGMEMNLIIL